MIKHFFLPSGTLLILFIGYFKRICKHRVENVYAYTGGNKQNLLKTPTAAGRRYWQHTLLTLWISWLERLMWLLFPTVHCWRQNP